MKSCLTSLSSLLALLLLSAPAIALDITDLKTDGWQVRITSLKQTITIDPLTIKDGKADIELKEGTPGWRGPQLLPGAAWTFGALRADSLVVTLAEDPQTKLILNTDYAVDKQWAAIAAVKESKYPPGTKVHVQYKYALSRIDLVEKTPAGQLVVVKGVEDKNEPLLPPATPGNTPLFSIYLPNHAVTLAPSYINMIDPTYDGVPPVTGREYLHGVQAKLAAGKGVTMVFLGDSITAQTNKDFKDQKGSFVDRLATYLQSTYPLSSVVTSEYGKPVPEPQEKQIIIAKAGVGGNDTVRALQRLEKDVLARKPDVVVVMFGVNDENRNGDGNAVPVETYKANLEQIVEKIRAGGGEVILMTPSMKNLQWSGTAGNMAEYAQAMREVAGAKKTCLVDNYRAWELLPKRGYNYMVFLGNCINHPIDLGHDLFFRGLRSAFTPEAKK